MKWIIEIAMIIIIIINCNINGTIEKCLNEIKETQEKEEKKICKGNN